MKSTLIGFGCLFGAIVLGCISLSSCGSTSSVNGVAPAPTERMARVSGVKLDTLNVGYRVYQNKCISCHTNDVPRAIPDRIWHPPSMGLNLYHTHTAEERYGVLEYLKAIDTRRFRFGSLQDT